MTDLDQDASNINTSAAAPGEVVLQISHPRSNTDGHSAELTIRDGASGLTIVRVRLNAEQFLDLMASTSVRVEGADLPAHPERIGKLSQNVSTTIRNGDPRTPEQVRDDYLTDGWDAVRIDRTNYGHRVVAYRWIDAPSSKEA